MKNILIINAHQKYEGFAEGKLNQTLESVAKETLEAQGCEVKTTYIEKGYDVGEEISKHEWADLVITQTPVYWFNAPWIYKKYIDEVFTTALSQGKLAKDDGRTRSDFSKQYGTGGLSQGKKFMLSTTWNAPKEAFDDKDQILLRGKSVEDTLINISTVYKFCGYEILKGISSFDVMKNPKVENDIKALKEKLNDLMGE